MNACLALLAVVLALATGFVGSRWWIDRHRKDKDTFDP